MTATIDRTPQQTRSQKTLARILESSISLTAEKPYDSISIAEITARAGVSVGGFYSRFENKESLFVTLQARLGAETHEKIEAALQADWNDASLRKLLGFIVENNAGLYEKYRGVLAAIYVRTRVIEPENTKQLQKYNANLVSQLEKLILKKRNEIRHKRPKVAVRAAIACMSSMLRDAVVFNDRTLYPRPGTISVVSRHVADIMHHHLVADTS